MSDIAEFLVARLDEDQRAADAVVFACRDSRQPWPPEQAPGRGGPALTEYLRHFSEHRSVREVEVKRAILAEHKHFHERIGKKVFGFGCGTCHWHPDFGMPSGINWCPTLRSLAAVYSDHPDYRPEWRLLVTAA